MEQLGIEFDGGNIRGSGSDIIGLFALTGTIEDGKVAIVKQYRLAATMTKDEFHGWLRYWVQRRIAEVDGDEDRLDINQRIGGEASQCA